MAKRILVQRPRNGGTWIEAQFCGRIRGALRKTFAAWIPMKRALIASRRACHRPDRPLLKFEYQCAACQKWFPLKEEGPEGKKLVQIDHKTGAGSLRSYDDIGPWVKRLTEEDPNAYQVLCLPCHQEKTNTDRSTP